MKPIQLFKPELDYQAILPDLQEIMEKGWIGLGPKTEQFENEFAARVGARYAVAVNSCTAALHLALKLYNIKDGAKVATTPMTFVSTNTVMLYERAVPVFVDVDPNTMSMDFDKLRTIIGENNISAIMVVHYGGQPIDMEPIYELANDWNIPIIEDAAHAAGARYKTGKAVGSNPSNNGVTCFSFHAVKNLPMGDGGVITTNLVTVAQRLKRLRWLGIDKSTYARTSEGYGWQYDVKEVGYKYTPNDIASTIGLHQLKSLEAHNLYRQQLYKWYKKYITVRNVKFVGLDKPDGSISSRHIIAIKVPHIYRDKLMTFLNDEDIYPGVHYYPNHLYPIFEEYRESLPVVEEEWQRLISLPCHIGIMKDDVKRISKAINFYLDF